MDKKKATPERAALNTHAHPIKLSPRQERLARALLHGPITREQADRLIPCSNAPEYIRQLRHKLALVLPCELVPFVTKDGEKSSYGRYYATEKDREKLAEALYQDGYKEAG
jgi:hypothetical protein